MEQLRYNTVNTKRNKQGIWSIHSVAMFMLGVYIILSSTFEFLESYGFLNSISLYAFLGLGALNIIYKRKVVFLENYYFVGILLYFVVLTISRFYTPMEIKSYVNMYYYRYFTMVVICFVTINLIESKEDIKYLLNAFVISGFVMVIAFVGVYGEEIFSLAAQVAEAERLGWDFGNLNLVAQRLTLSLIFSLYMSIFVAKNKIIYLLSSFSCMTVVLLTGSRKALLVIAVIAVCMFLSFSKGKSLNFKICSFLIIATTIAIVTYLIVNVSLFSSIRDRMEITINTLLGTADMYETKSDANRMRYMSEGIRYWLKKPFMGNGMAYAYYLFGTYSHNNYIELLLNTGLIGFCTYYYPFVKTFLYGVSKKVDAQKSFQILVSCIIIAIAIIDIGVVSYYDRYICILMSAISSVLVSGTVFGKEQQNISGSEFK